MYKINLDLINKAFDVAEIKELSAIQYMIAQYQKAIHFERNEDAAMMELAIHKFVCHHTNYAIQE